MKKSLLCILLCLTMLSALVACNAPTPPENAPQDGPEALLDGPAELLFDSAEPYVTCTESILLDQASVLTASCVHSGVLYYTVKSGNGISVCRRTLPEGEPTVGPELALGDAVSMCYDERNGMLVVAHGDSTVSTVDPQTLALVSSYTTSGDVTCITYLKSEEICIAMMQGKRNPIKLDADYAMTGVLSLPSAMLSYTLLDMTADSEHIYFLVGNEKGAGGKKAAGVLIYHIEQNTCLKNVFLFEMNGRTPVTLSINGADFLIGTTGVRFMDSFFSGALTAIEGEERPYRIFSRWLHNDVDEDGLRSQKLFDVYRLASDLGSHTVMQGGGTDGKYGYFCMEDQKNDYHNTPIHTTCIVKVDMETNELVAVSDPLPLGHSNDLCYNSRTGKLLVVHCGFTPEDTARVSIVNPETLTIEEVITLPFGTHCMAYDAVADQYMVGRGRDFAILDSNFEILVPKVNVGAASFCQEEELITQGGDCDSDYVYYVLGGKNSSGPWVNYLVVYDWNGNLIAAKIIPDMTAESENIFHIGNTIYVACNGGNDPVYRIDLEP